MKILGALRLAQQMLTGDTESRSRAYYLVKQKLRGIDLNGTNDEESGDPERGFFYSDSGGPELERVLGTLHLSKSDAVIDMGCGKGGAMITLAEFFGRVDGVEYDADLAQVGRQNMERLGLRRSTIYHCDASAFVDL